MHDSLREREEGGREDSSLISSKNQKRLYGLFSCAIELGIAQES